MPDFDLPLIVLAATVTIAGVARGVSGFGTGMIVAPVAGALYGPQAALVIIVMIDSIPIIPLTIPAVKLARWREVLPVISGLLLFFPAGLFILTHGNVSGLRWVISIAILACVAVLYSGYRYGGPRNLATSFGVGGVAGVLYGIASIPGPPIIAYWMASGFSATIIRANLLVLFFLGEFVSAGNLWFAGLFEKSVVLTALVAVPFYFSGLLIGWRLFGLASERAYRLVTLGLVVAAAITALPLFDGSFTAMATRFR